MRRLAIHETECSWEWTARKSIPTDGEMMYSINDIGRLTGGQTIAEWAENEEIVEVLRGLGVNDTQGHGVSQPPKVWRAATA